MRQTPEDAYLAYVNWMLKIGIPPLSRVGYEMALAKIPTPSDNKIDAIVRNNEKRRDK